MNIKSDDKSLCVMHEERIVTMEKDIRQINTNYIELKADVNTIKEDTKEIKAKIDNGLMSIITEIKEKVIVMAHEHKDHAFWIGKIKWAVVFVAVVVVCGGLAKVILDHVIK